MFKATTSNSVEQLNSVKYRVKEIFSVKNVVIYIITLLISMISINGKVYPFGFAMVAASVGESIPVIGVFISALIGTAITGGVSSFFHFVVVSIFYVVFVLIFRSYYAIEERNESFKTGGKLFGAYTFVGFFKCLFYGFTFKNFILEILTAAIIYVFYKMTVNGLSYVENIDKKEVFTNEEMTIGGMLVVLAVASLYQFAIIPIYVLLVISFIILSIIGAKQGIVKGILSGISYAFVLWLLIGINLQLMILFVVAAFIGGILGKTNNIIIIITIVLSNIVLLIIKDIDPLIITFSRLIIFSQLILLFIHKNLKINKEDLFEDSDMLGEGSIRGLNPPREFEFEARLKKLNDDLNEIISKNPYTLDDSGLINDYKDEFIKNLKEIEDSNILVSEIVDTTNTIAYDISKNIIQNGILTSNAFLEIMQYHNNYLVLRDSKIVDAMHDIVRIANITFESSNYREKREELKEETLKQSEEILGKVEDYKVVKYKEQEKEPETEEEKMYRTLKKQIMELLKNKNIRVEDVNLRFIENGKTIIELKFDYFDTRIKNKDVTDNISDNLSKIMQNKIVLQREKNDDVNRTYSQIYSTDDKFILQVGSSRISKDESEISGDCSLQIRLSDGKYLLAIADRGESSPESRERTKKDLRVLKQILVNGYNDNITREKIFEIIEKKNGIINLHLDIMILDLYAGQIDIFKYNSIKSLRKSGKDVKIISSKEKNGRMYHYSHEAIDGDIFVLASDGVVKSTIKDEWIDKFLVSISTTNVQRMADYILEEAIENNFGNVQDDMTVIVCRIIKKK